MKTALVILVLAMIGCASLPQGVEMKDGEREACAVESCSVWTPAQLEALIHISLQTGFEAGRNSKSQGKRKGELSL